ncbi:MAG TPA: glycosyltransferase family 4 protein [Chlamydiales bacterium]|jgi:glycosyltransferase involved in cell wall biosynthesis|nr:glycosyltransferase family 4 protein [Chlamydiales bacterium]
MKTALVHDWLVSPVGGAENTLQEIFALYPSPIHTLLWNPTAFQTTRLSAATVHSSFIQKLPWARTRFRSYLPLFPLAIEQFDLSGYDLILSSSHCVAKGVLTHSEQTHICYCHTPMRYAWDLYHEYLRTANLHRGMKGVLARFFLHSLRSWDVHSSPRVDHFIANSQFVARRIRKFYGRDAAVIYPPVDTSFYSLSEKKENYYLTSSRLVPYKKIDLIVEAFSRLPDLTLVVIGDGPEAKNLRKKASKNVEFLGFQPSEVLRQYMQKAKAFVFAALEDFGITPIEAMASGTPVIALGKGGTAETILPEKTGLFFENQTALDIYAAIQQFEKTHDRFDPRLIRAHATSFSAERFRSEVKQFVEDKVK